MEERPRGLNILYTFTPKQREGLFGNSERAGLITGLSDRQKELIRLKYGCAATHAAIAQELGISTATITNELKTIHGVILSQLSQNP